MAYETGSVRSGGSAAQNAAAAADAASSRLRAATIGAGMFGVFDGAERLATGLGTVRDDHTRMAYDVRARHLELHAGAVDTAAVGDQLVADTTAAAQRGDAARAITEGMYRPS